MSSPPPPPAPPGPALDEQFWDLLARADRILGNPRPERERVGPNNALVRETQRKVPGITSAIEGAVRRFEAVADKVEAHFRNKLRDRPSPDDSAAARAAHGPDARLALIEARIRKLQRELVRMRRRVAEAADEADAWEQRAMLAVEIGDDPTALDAMRHRRAHALDALALAREADAGALVLREMCLARDELRALHTEAEQEQEPPSERSPVRRAP
jgi:hypothetical protein